MLAEIGGMKKSRLRKYSGLPGQDYMSIKHPQQTPVAVVRGLEIPARTQEAVRSEGGTMGGR
ncbi:hypothetical protein BKA00_006338 [Actinomadura coerulea]|uniref:Uncharacterized protein n=1 Tax=Actinomadura coerulea TaxID=46159 RepID=A0A7X0L2N0_9ACTN|nr:hypothetical protein [Actinomadura coerulea]MBB6399424.1 hypothetical protein [Actinomadura coerulea]